MKYKALRQIYGDYGMQHPGAVFDVPDNQVKAMERLERAGVVMRFRPAVDRKAYTVYQNKAIQPPLNKVAK